MPRDVDVDHHLDGADGNVHHVWDNGLEPRLTVESGDVIRFECPVGFAETVDPGTTGEEFHDAWDPVGHYLVGPVAVEGVRAGEALEVEVLEVRHGGWGHTFFRPGAEGRGLLVDEFDEPGFYLWDLDGDVGRFVDGIEVPLEPFPGNLGVAPAEPGEHSSIPPRRVGGNIDVPQLTAGATALFPVEVDGAMFSVGDGHAAQGDGEVCLSAIETSLEVTLRLSRRRLDLERPRFRTPGREPAGPVPPTLVTSGIADDLYEAARQAVSDLVAVLVDERDLDREHAYILCSVAADLRISEIVNEPNYVVTAHLSEGLFPGADVGA